MSKWTKRVIGAVGYLVMCWASYQLLGWLGILFLVGGGAIGGVATIFINRKVRKDEQMAQFRSSRDPFNTRDEGFHPEP